MPLKMAEFNALNSFMKDIAKPTTIDQLNELLQRTLGIFGVKHLLAISAFGMPALQDRKPMFGFRSTDWLSHYRKNHYHQDDALPQAAIRLKKAGSVPLWWTSFIANQHLSDLQYKIFREAYTFGLREGVVIPLHVRVDIDNKIEEYAFVSLGGDFERSDELENSLTLVAYIAHKTARTILMDKYRAGGAERFVEDPIVSFAPNVNFSVLGNRELEVIRQFVDNETLDEVGRALNIKVSTVKTHLKNAREKLGFSSNKEMIVALLRHRELS